MRSRSTPHLPRSFAPFVWVSAAVFGPLAPAFGQAPVARSPVEIHRTSGGMSIDPAPLAAAADGARAVVLLRDATSGSLGVSLLALVSDDAGLSWNGPIGVDRDPSGAAPDATDETGAALVGDLVLATWIDARLSGSGSALAFNRSTDGGFTFEASDRLLPDGKSGQGRIGTFRMLAQDDPAGVRVHVVFTVRGPGLLADEVWLTSSYDGGASFDPAVKVFSGVSSGIDAEGLGLAALGDQLFVAWDDDTFLPGTGEVWLRRSLDAGRSFPAPRLQMNRASTGASRDARLVGVAAVGNLVVVSFDESDVVTGSAIEHRSALSSDGGASFASDQRVGGAGGAFHCERAPYLALDRAVFIGTDARGVVALLTLDGGASFLASVLDPLGASPRLAGANGQLAATWTAAGETAQALYGADSTSGGLLWFAPLVLVDEPDASASRSGALLFEPTLANVIAVSIQDPPSGSGAATRLLAGGFSLCDKTLKSERNAGTNPTTLDVDEPVLGKLWTATLDLAASGHALGVVLGAIGPLNLPLSGGQVLLVDLLDPSGELFAFTPKVGPRAVFAQPVFNDPRLCGTTLSVQGVAVGGAPFALTRAFDLVLGAL